MITKRSREDTDVEELAMANCMALISNIAKTTANAIPDCIFPCKTCGKQFASFQALGGHRASHKRPRLSIMVAEDHRNHNGNKGNNIPHSIAKPTGAYQCSICGMKFAMGQALGGHMRRHRVEDDQLISSSSSEAASLTQSDVSTTIVSAETASNCSPKSKYGGGSSKGLLLDLNLTPYENEVKFGRF